MKPVVSTVHSVQRTVNDASCGFGVETSEVWAAISDATEPDAQLRVSATWSFTGSAGTFAMPLTSTHNWDGELGPFNARPAQNLVITVTVTASDPAGNTATGTTTLTYSASCPVVT